MIKKPKKTMRFLLYSTCIFSLLIVFLTLLLPRNEFEKIKHMQNKPCVEERQAKASLISLKVLEKYKNTQYLSFQVECIYYFYKDTNINSLYPLSKNQRQVAKVNTKMSHQNLKTDIFTKEQPLYVFIHNKDFYQEYKYPHNGIPGQYTQYPFDPRWIRLNRGVDPELICETGMYRTTWIGPNAHQPIAFKNMMDEGIWLGEVVIKEQECDLIFLESKDPIRWDAFYVNSQGFVIQWYIMMKVDKQDYDWVILSKYYYNFNYNSLSAEDFQPSNNLTMQTASWQVL